VSGNYAIKDTEIGPGLPIVTVHLMPNVPNVPNVPNFSESCSIEIYFLRNKVRCPNDMEAAPSYASPALSIHSSYICLIGDQNLTDCIRFQNHSGFSLQIAYGVTKHQPGFSQRLRII
jgi:hypothetical protein